MSTRARLFDEFPPVSAEAWEDQIRRDLGDADVAETLLWHTPDGLTVRPYYRSEDLQALPHLAGIQSVEIRSEWMLLQTINARDLKVAVARVRDALAGGGQAIGLMTRVEQDGLSGVPVQSSAALRLVLEEIPLDTAALHLDAGLQTPMLFAMLLNEAERMGHSQDITGSLGFDPLSEVARTGKSTDAAFDAAAGLISDLRSEMPAFRLLCAGGHVYHEAGATVVQEAALVLAGISEYMVLLIDRGLSVPDVLRRLFVSTSISTSYFLEIAKLRALRLLIPQVIDGFHPDGQPAQLPIHAATSARNMTRFDAHTNLLRATTEAASAVVGGCDVLEVRPFDDPLGEPGDFGMRLARNIQHLLMYEGRLHCVNDPAAGSYYVEWMTDAVARRAWQLFQEIERSGGLLASLEAGFIQDQLTSSRQSLESDVAMKRRILVGTNQYPDPSEKLDAESSERSFIQPETSNPTASANLAELRRHAARGGTLADLQWERHTFADPLQPFREGELLEEVRLATQRNILNPSVVILPIGDPRTRSSRAQFAANFLGCGGFEAEVPFGYDDIDSAVADAPSSCDLLVVAAPDALYTLDVMAQLNEGISASIVGIVAADELSLEVDFRINRHTHLLDTLRFLQRQLAPAPSNL